MRVDCEAWGDGRGLGDGPGPGLGDGPGPVDGRGPGLGDGPGPRPGPVGGHASADRRMLPVDLQMHALQANARQAMCARRVLGLGLAMTALATPYPFALTGLRFGAASPGLTLWPAGTAVLVTSSVSYAMLQLLKIATVGGPRRTGHFGLVGMVERAAGVGAR